MLRNEVGWFDDEDNSADTLSMRLANNASCYFQQPPFNIYPGHSSCSCSSSYWGPSGVAPGSCSSGDSAHSYTLCYCTETMACRVGIQEMHRKASLVLEDAVRNICTVVAFCAGNKVMELYKLQLVRIYNKSFLHWIAIGFTFSRQEG